MAATMRGQTTIKPRVTFTCCGWMAKDPLGCNEWNSAHRVCYNGTIGKIQSIWNRRRGEFLLETPHGHNVISLAVFQQPPDVIDYLRELLRDDAEFMWPMAAYTALVLNKPAVYPMLSEYMRIALSWRDTIYMSVEDALRLFDLQKTSRWCRVHCTFNGRSIKKSLLEFRLAYLFNQALRTDDEALLLALQKQRPDYSYRTFYNDLTPAHIAAISGSERVLKALLKLKPALLFATDRSGRNILSLAATHNRIELMTSLANLVGNRIKPLLRRALWDACFSGTQECIELLISWGVSRRNIGPNNDSILHRLAMRNDPLLYAHFSALYPRLKTCLNHEGIGPAVGILDRKSWAIFDEIIDDERSMLHVDRYHRSLLHWAAALGESPCYVKIAAKYPYLINREDTEFYTPLMMAIKCGRSKVVENIFEAALTKKNLNSLKIGQAVSMATAFAEPEILCIILRAHVRIFRKPTRDLPLLLVRACSASRNATAVCLLEHYPGLIREYLLWRKITPDDRAISIPNRIRNARINWFKACATNDLRTLIALYEQFPGLLWCLDVFRWNGAQVAVIKNAEEVFRQLIEWDWELLKSPAANGVSLLHMRLVREAEEDWSTKLGLSKKPKKRLVDLISESHTPVIAKALPLEDGPQLQISEHWSTKSSLHNAPRKPSADLISGSDTSVIERLFSLDDDPQSQDSEHWSTKSEQQSLDDDPQSQDSEHWSTKSGLSDQTKKSLVDLISNSDARSMAEALSLDDDAQSQDSEHLSTESGLHKLTKHWVNLISETYAPVIAKASSPGDDCGSGYYNGLFT